MPIASHVAAAQLEAMGQEISALHARFDTAGLPVGIDMKAGSVGDQLLIRLHFTSPRGLVIALVAAVPREYPAAHFPFRYGIEVGGPIIDGDELKAGIEERIAARVPAVTYTALVLNFYNAVREHFLEAYDMNRVARGVAAMNI
jgi:hypothetical protein